MGVVPRRRESACSVMMFGGVVLVVLAELLLLCGVPSGEMCVLVWCVVWGRVTLTSTGVGSSGVSCSASMGIPQRSGFDALGPASRVRIGLSASRRQALTQRKMTSEGG